MLRKNNNNDLSVSFLISNTNGLNETHKIQNLLNFSKSVRADILITTEPHWKDRSPTEDPKLRRWTIIQSLNETQTASGGVAVWFRKEFTVTNTFISNRIVSVDLTRNGQDMRIIAIYAPTGNKKEMLAWWQANQAQLLKLTTKKNVFIGGDFNFVTNPEDSTKGKVYKKIVEIWRKIEKSKSLVDLKPNCDA